MQTCPYVELKAESAAVTARLNELRDRSVELRWHADRTHDVAADFAEGARSASDAVRC